jgi:hypothetical protein
MDIEYKPLKTAFRSKGFDYRQIERKGDIAMFEQTKPGLSGKWFEVVVVQRHDGYELGGKPVEPAESMPSSSQWGKKGFTFRTQEAAERKFQQLSAASVHA